MQISEEEKPHIFTTFYTFCKGFLCFKYIISLILIWGKNLQNFHKKLENYTPVSQGKFEEMKFLSHGSDVGHFLEVINTPKKLNLDFLGENLLFLYFNLNDWISSLGCRGKGLHFIVKSSKSLMGKF